MRAKLRRLFIQQSAKNFVSSFVHLFHKQQKSIEKAAASLDSRRGLRYPVTKKRPGRLPRQETPKTLIERKDCYGNFGIGVADNFYNSCPVVLDRIKQITGKDFRFFEADVTKTEQVEHIFNECPDINAVIQFAAYKAVGESVKKPIEYYTNNLNCTLTILDVMRRHNCHNFVFSSSATVYGDPPRPPSTATRPASPSPRTSPPAPPPTPTAPPRSLPNGSSPTSARPTPA